MSSKIFYSGVPLNREHHLRKQNETMQALLYSDKARFILLQKNQHIFSNLYIDNSPTIIDFCLTDITSLVANVDDFVFLGQQDDCAYFCVEVSDDHNDFSIINDASTLDLRDAHSYLSAEQAATLAYARGMMHWHRTHLHCGMCGSSTKPCDSGHKRVCTQCHHGVFPRTDPAVIMLVERINAQGVSQCLLAHHKRWAEIKYYSTLAGFVEPGETLEEAVIREVHEEVGITVDRVSYKGSQPWPFPASIMLGFRAVAVDNTLSLQEDEITDARWFSREEILALENQDNEEGIVLPRKDSIARALVNDWLHDSKT